MPLTTEELLIPRYKVIGDYPDNQMKIGAIFESKNMSAYYDRFPCVFMRLGWWEDRDMFELPEYIKLIIPFSWLEDISLYEVIKPTSYIIGQHGAEVIYLGLALPIKKFSPSTEQEYIDYQNSLKK